MISTHIATLSDKSYLSHHYRHMSQTMFERKVALGEYMIIADDQTSFGWLRWGYFWDLIPMMNMLHIEQHYRAQGYGKQLVEAWERHMRQAGHEKVMTSTQANESAQHFYRKLGYQDSGALLLPDEALEIIFIKNLNKENKQ